MTTPFSPVMEKLLWLMQINRLAGLAVCLHCLLPTAWVPPLTTPSAAIINSAGMYGAITVLF